MILGLFVWAHLGGTQQWKGVVNPEFKAARVTTTISRDWIVIFKHPEFDEWNIPHL